MPKTKKIRKNNKSLKRKNMFHKNKEKTKKNKFIGGGLSSRDINDLNLKYKSNIIFDKPSTTMTILKKIYPYNSDTEEIFNDIIKKLIDELLKISKTDKFINVLRLIKCEMNNNCIIIRNKLKEIIFDKILSQSKKYEMSDVDKININNEIDNLVIKNKTIEEIKKQLESKNVNTIPTNTNKIKKKKKPLIEPVPEEQKKVPVVESEPLIETSEGEKEEQKEEPVVEQVPESVVEPEPVPEEQKEEPVVEQKEEPVVEQKEEQKEEPVPVPEEQKEEQKEEPVPEPVTEPIVEQKDLEFNNMFDEFNEEISIPNEIDLSMIFDETIPSIDETISSINETDNFNIIFPEVPTGITKIKPNINYLTPEKFKEMSETMKLYYKLQEKLKNRKILKQKLLRWFYDNNNKNKNNTETKEKIIENIKNIDDKLKNENDEFYNNLTPDQIRYFVIESSLPETPLVPETQPVTPSAPNEEISSSDGQQPVTPSAPPLPSESHYMKSLKFVKTIIENMTNEYVYSN